MVKVMLAVLIVGILVGASCMWGVVKIKHWQKHKKEVEWRKWKDEI